MVSPAFDDMNLPTIPQLLAYKLLKRTRNARSRVGFAGNRQRPVWIETVIKLTLHIAGFIGLTIAGFHFNFIAGMVVFSLSCFVLSALLFSSDSQQDTGGMR